MVFDCESHIIANNRGSPKEIWESGNVTTRSVHKLCWGIENPSLLVSGNQDGIIRMFDVRVKNNTTSNPSCVNSFNPKSEAIKDIQFDPFNHDYFAAISDNGHVSIFDFRQEDTPVHKFLAHTSAGLCLAYHPSRNKVLATGGKDKYVKIWSLPDIPNAANVSDDSKSQEVPVGTSPFTSVGTLNHQTSHSGNGHSTMNTTSDRLMHTTPRSFASIRTPGQVSKIRWRPGNERRFESQLATSSIERNEVYVWNTNLPHLPICTLQGHTDVCTDFQWVDTPSSTYKSPLIVKKTKSNEPTQDNSHDEFLHVHQHMLSISKDGKILLQDLRNSYFPRQHIFGHGVGLSSLGDLAHHAGQIPKMDLFGFDTFTDQTVIKNGESSPFSDQPDKFGMDFSQQHLAPSDPIFHLVIPSPDTQSVLLNRYQTGSLNASVSFHKPIEFGSPSTYTKSGLKKNITNESPSHSQDVSSANSKLKRADTKALASSLATLSSASKVFSRARSPRGSVIPYTSTSSGPPTLSSGRSAHRSQLQHGNDRRTPLTELLANDFGAFNVNPDFRMLFSGSGRIETPTFTRSSREGESVVLDTISSGDDYIYLEKSFISSSQVGLFFGGSVYIGPTNIDSLETARQVREERNGAEGRKFDPAVMRLLAEEYIHGGREKGLLPKESCRHNLAVAQRAGFMCRASVFGTILTLLPDVEEKSGGRVEETDTVSKGNINSNNKTTQSTTPQVSTQNKEPSSIQISSTPKAASTSSTAILPFTVELMGEILLDMLDIGDCQHFVIACEIILQTSKVLLERCLESAKIPSTRRLEAYYSYIELLRRFQQFSKVNEIIMQTDIANSEVLNQRGVLIHISCSICGKELPDQISTPWCQKCRRTVGLCVVCNEPVRGLIRWCAVCGHGGHTDCTRVWFSRCNTCPSGCGHDCNALAQYAMNSNPVDVE